MITVYIFKRFLGKLFEYWGITIFMLGVIIRRLPEKNDAKFDMAFGERFPPNLPPKNPPNLYENTVICDNLRTFFLNAKNPRNALNTGFYGDLSTLMKFSLFLHHASNFISKIVFFLFNAFASLKANIINNLNCCICFLSTIINIFLNCK